MMISHQRWMAISLFGWLLFLSGSVWGAEADDGTQSGGDPTGLQYVALGPPLVTNYDGGGRLKYLKTRVTLRARPPGTEAIQRHLPYLRNQLVMLFSRQLEEDLTSTRGKDRLQREALRAVREALAQLEGQAVADTVINLYFPEYVIQS